MQVIDIPDEWTEKLKTMSGEDAKNIYNYYNEHKPVKLESGLGVGATTEAALQTTAQQFEVLPEAGEIFMGMNQVHYGNALRGFAETQNKDSLLSKLATGFGNALRWSGEETIKTANRSLEEVRKKQAEEAVPISQEEREGMYFRTVATVPSFAATIGLSMIPYAGPALGATFVGTQAFAGATTESIESYKQEHPEDKGLEGYLKATDKEIGKIYLKTLASMASEYMLGDIPVSKSFKNMLREGRALRQGIKAGTLKPLTKLGVAGEALKAGAKSGGQEAMEELVEGLAYTAIDYDKINTSDELWDRINDSMKDAVAAFFVAGPVGGGVYVSSRANAISGVREALKNSMPEQDAATVAAITVDNHIRNLRDVALVSVQASTEFAQKRGEIYDRFSGEVAKAMRESGAFNNMSEEDFVEYVSETASKFADNISGMAIQRKQLIPQVLDANKIVYKDGQLFLEGYKGGKTTTEQKMFQESMDIAQENSRLDAMYPEYTGETIDINGVQLTVYNSDGTRIAKSAEALQNFYNWFGDSKVVDEQGRPLVVYHGANAEFDTFDKNKAFDGAFYFSPNKEYAKGYGNIMPTYLSIKNPTTTIPSSRIQKEEFSKQGFDGVAYKDTSGLEIFAAFNPNQIKSIDNGGTYSATDENIYHQEGEEKDLYATHNMSLAGVTQALKMGGFAMPSLALRKTSQGNINQFGEVVFVGDENMVKPSRSTEVYDRDAWTPNLGYAVRYDLGAETNTFINKVLEKAGQKERESVFRYNIQENIATPTSNDMAIELYALDKGVEENYYEMRNSQDYIDWYEEHISSKAEPYLFTENDANTDMIRRKFTLNNMMKVLRKQEKSGGGFIGDYIFDVYKLLNFHSQKFKNIKEIKKAKGKLVSTQEQFESNKALNDEFLSLSEKLKKEGQEYGFGDATYGVGLALIQNNEKDIKYWLDYKNLKSDENAIKDVKDFISKMQNNVLTDYFEVKPRRIVEIGEFSGVIVPKGKQYDAIAKTLEEKYYLPVERVEKGNESEYEQALQNIYKKHPKTFFQKGKVKRGEYNAAKKAIKLFKDANLSTIPHELAHYYLDNMWTYVLSGMASNEYLDNFIAVRDFLGIRKDQLKLTTAQHEKFASAYEKYLYSGKAPNDKLVGAFNGYDRWLKGVYRDINEIKAQGKYSFELTPEMVQFFDNMTTGELMTPAESAEVATIATTNEVKQADDKTVKEAKEVIKQTPVPETKSEFDVKPVETEGKKKESRLFARVKEATEIDGKMDYTVVELDEQRKKATELWQKDPVRAENILNGIEKADDILRSALYTEQQRLALERGDRATFEASVRKQSAEATRMGQELSALRGVVEDITMPAYWLRYAENEAMKQLAKQMTPVFNKHIDKSVLQQLTSQLDADIKELYNKVNSIESGKEKANALKEGITDLKKKYKGLEQPDMVFNQTGYEEMTQDYVEKKAKEALGIYLPDAMVDEIIQKARDLDTLSNQVDSLGLPTSAFFAKKAELEATVNRHTPTSQVKVALSIIGRSNMLTAPATTVLNVTTNASNYATQLELRRITNKVAGHTNDILVDENLRKQYRQKAWKVFWETGYDMSMLKDLTDTRLYKGESITHSEGDGVIRAVGRFAEKWVFSRLISAPDVYFKSMKAFTDFAANEATEIAYKEGLTGEKAKQRATEIWKDAILVEPQTEQGKSARQKAQVDSLVVTFQQDTELSKNLLKLREWINKSTGDIGVGDLLSPFVKTPTNILSMGFDATIGPFASPRNLIAAYNDVRRGQFNTLPVQQAVKQTAFAAIAYTVMALLVSALIDDDDYIPDYSQLTQAERNAVKEAGGAYGSVLIGGTYISTDFFGPFEMPLVAILNSRRYDSVIKGLSTTVLHQLSNAPVLKDFAETTESLKEIGEGQIGILEAVYDGVTNAVTTRAVPNVLNVIAKATDDYERETNRSAINKLKAKVPVLRQTLPEKVSKATGRKVETQPIWLQMLLGSRGHIKVDNKLANELKRLSETGQGASLSDVTKSGDLKSVPDDKKQRINEEFAKEYSKLVGALVKTSEYKKKTDEEKKKAINKVREGIVRSLKTKYSKYIKKGLKKAK